MEEELSDCTNSESEDITQEEVRDEKDENYISYLEEDNREEIVRNIFRRMKEYIRDQALPLCEFITIDDIETLIEKLNV